MDVNIIIWFALVVVFILLEVQTLALVSVWFALASVILVFMSSFIGNFIYEFYVFVALSGIFLVLTRPVVKKLLKKRKPLESRILGQEVEIRKKLSSNLYEVKLDGKYWNGICKKELGVGEIGIVEAIEGNKLILKKK